MASIGTLTADVLVTVKDLVAVRQRALELALENAPNGTKFRETVELADVFAKFILEGDVPDKPSK